MNASERERTQLNEHAHEREEEREGRNGWKGMKRKEGRTGEKKRRYVSLFDENERELTNGSSLCSLVAPSDADERRVTDTVQHDASTVPRQLEERAAVERRERTQGTKELEGERQRRERKERSEQKKQEGRRTAHANVNVNDTATATRGRQRGEMGNGCAGPTRSN